MNDKDGKGDLVRRAQEEISRGLDERGAAANAHYERAATLFEEAGMEKDAKYARALKEEE
jgi:hypothetical protein